MSDFAGEYQKVEGLTNIPLVDVRSYRPCEAAALYYLERGEFGQSECNTFGILVSRLANKGWGFDKAILIAEIAHTIARHNDKYVVEAEILPKVISQLKERRGLRLEIDHRAIPVILGDDYHEEIQDRYEDAARGNYTWPKQPVTDEALREVFMIVNREYDWMIEGPKAA